MVDNRSIGGTIATIFLTALNDVTRNNITFFLAVGVASTTVVYNLIKISSEIKNKK